MKKIIRQGVVASALLSAFVAAGGVGLVPRASAQVSNEGALILNEYNAVGPEKFLENNGSDTFFGQIQGNGGDWLELVVTENHLDIRGWTIEWENDDPDAGTVSFTNHALWSNLKAGTIITIRAGDTTDTSVNCSTGDWWIRIGAEDTTYITQTGHSFKTDNDGWRASILDDNAAVVQDWVGEPPNGVIWAGSGINSQEVGKLEEDPSATASNYQDGSCSSFGSPNCWNGGADEQDFSSLRSCP